MVYRRYHGHVAANVYATPFDTGSATPFVSSHAANVNSKISVGNQTNQVW